MPFYSPGGTSSGSSSGGGASSVNVRDEGALQGTAATLNFVGTQVIVSVSGTTATIAVAHGDQGGGTEHTEATTTTAGFLSAEDKAKLDALLSSVYDVECASTVLVGDCVAINSGATAQLATIATLHQTPAIGVVISKSSATQCRVQFSGYVTGIYSGLSPGKVYFVGTDGRPSPSPPTSTGVWSIQKIGIALSANVFLALPSLDIMKRHE